MPCALHQIRRMHSAVLCLSLQDRDVAKKAVFVQKYQAASQYGLHPRTNGLVLLSMPMHSSLFVLRTLTLFSGSTYHPLLYLATNFLYFSLLLVFSPSVIPFEFVGSSSPYSLWAISFQTCLFKRLVAIQRENIMYPVRPAPALTIKRLIARMAQCT